MADGRPPLHRSSFDDLSPRDLYDILRLRSEVFVVEQECVFLDLDDRDHEPDAEHLWIRDGAGVAAALRILREGDDAWSIGRVVTRPDVRRTGVASRLMDAALDILDERSATDVRLGAQTQHEGWYARFGFSPSGPEYVEDGIPHVPMRRRPDRAAR